MGEETGLLQETGAVLPGFAQSLFESGGGLLGTSAGLPHAGQDDKSEAPQPVQKRAPSRLGCPQARQAVLIAAPKSRPPPSARP